jgi:hypothetical protein
VHSEANGIGLCCSGSIDLECDCMGVAGYMYHIRAREVTTRLVKGSRYRLLFTYMRINL